MDKLTQLNKLSKKARKKYYAKKRGQWNGIKPVTRTIPSGKIYDRKKNKADLRHGISGDD